MAATIANGTPTTNARATYDRSSGGTVAAVATQKIVTVDDVSLTAPCAISQPRGAPIAHPTTDRHTASPRNSASTFRRDVPTVRSIPISARRVITETETVL